MQAATERSIFAGVCLTAGATLLLEVALTRVLSFTIWYHFAYVVLSAALLGFGAAGSSVAVWPRFGRDHPQSTLGRLSLAASLSTLGLLGLLAVLPLDPMVITEDAGQAVAFVVYLLAAAVPFFLSGLVVSVALRECAAAVHRLYFWDLLGAAAGCAAAVPAMNAVSPPGVVLVAAAAFALAAVILTPARLPRVLGVALALVTLGMTPWAERAPLTPANSKHLPQHIALQAMEPVAMHWSALFRTDVLRSTAGTPYDLSYEWGGSRTMRASLQAPWGTITHDGSAGTPIYDLRAGDLPHLEEHVLDLPYQIVPTAPRVLVIGVGGGRDLVTALRHSATQVTGVELDPATIDVLRNEFGELHAGSFAEPRVHLVAAEGRHFTASTQESFDVIQITGVDTLAAATSGAYVLAESYLYTVEAFSRYLELLTPEGVLSLGNGIADPNDPVAGIRFVSVASEALRRAGVARPDEHIAFIDSGYMLAEMLVKREPFREDEREHLRAECERLGFRILLLGDEGLPVMRAISAGNAGLRESLYRKNRYQIWPTTDDRPFFFQFYRWSSLMEADDRGPMHSSALGQTVLVLLFAALTLLAVFFVLGPLAQHTATLRQFQNEAKPLLLYFACLGAGFMLFEVSLIQRFVVYLGYPTYSLSIVLFSLLASLGLGSRISSRWVGRERTVLLGGLGSLVVFVVVLSVFLPFVQRVTLSQPLIVRALVTVAILAPLGIVLGMFLPLGVRRAERVHGDMVPWAWAANGCASVSATVLSIMLAMTWGFRAVWVVSLVIYALGVWTFLRMKATLRSELAPG